MSDSISTAKKEHAAHTVINEWIADYLPAEDATTAAATGEADEKNFVTHLLARFNELDLAPRDGQVSIFEIERAIANPLLTFTKTDLEMLKLLRRFYSALVELHDSEEGKVDFGITRADVSILANCMTGSGKKLRERIETEYRKA